MANPAGPSGTRRLDAPPGSAALFLQVWLPSFLVFFASGLALFSLNFWVTHRSGGAVLGVIVGVANVVSVVAVVFFSGLIDRTDRRRFALRTKAVLGVALGALALVYAFDGEVGLLLVAAACYLLVECAYAVYMATIETTVADLAPAAWSARRTAALIALQPQVERTVAPLVGSLLIAAGLLVVLPVLALAWVGVTAAFAWRLGAGFVRPGREEHAAGAGDAAGRTAAREETGRRRRLDPLRLLGTTGADVKLAWRWIRRDPVLVYLMLVGVAVNLVLFPFYVLMPAYIAEFPGLPTDDQALLYGRAAMAYGIGMLTSTALLARFSRRNRRAVGPATACVLVLSGLLWTVSVAPPVVVVPAMGVTGLVFVVLVAVAGAGWLERTPADMRARVFSVRRLLVFSSIPLGTSLMGFGGAAMGYFAFLRVLLVLVVAATLVGLALYARAAGGAPTPSTGQGST